MECRICIFAAALLFAAPPTSATSDEAFRIYATWNPFDAHDLLEFDNDRLTVANGRNFWAGSRATMSVAEGVWYWEITYRYFPLGFSDAQTGLAWTNWSVSDPPGAFGSVARAVGTNRAGDILVGGNLLASIGPVADEAVVRHLLDADTGNYQVANGGEPWVSATLFPGYFSRTPQFPIVSVRAGAVVTANFGASAFVYEVPAGAHPGIYIEYRYDDYIMRDGFEW
ncbi:hypothetical protein [Dokdonella ginsengisoli]|uniref:B30.2/SPRY domain-containing protein n=1 Tax=Dokdonella ginsengisoli TaxID=363846 RepID=A0ABV9QWX7_9GAMM